MCFKHVCFHFFLFFFRLQIRYASLHCLSRMSFSVSFPFYGVIPYLIESLQFGLDTNSHFFVQRSYLALSNIFDDYCITCTPIQIQDAIDEGLFIGSCRLLQSSEFSSHSQAIRIIESVISSGTEEQIMNVFNDVRVLKSFCDLMASREESCVFIILSGLKYLFTLADKKGCLEQFSMVCAL